MKVAETKSNVNEKVLTDFKEINSLIDTYYAGRCDCLINILHSAQSIYGYLPAELQRFIADKMDIPVSQVSGIVSFYSFFTMKERGLHTIRVCLGTACYVRGGKKLVDHLRKTLKIEIGDTTADGLFTFEIARCIGACGLSPAMMIDDDVYQQVTPAKLDSILAKYKVVKGVEKS